MEKKSPSQRKLSLHPSREWMASEHQDGDEHSSIGSYDSEGEREREHSDIRRAPSDIEGDEEGMTMGMFFKKVMNNGAEDNVACYKLIVMLILVLAAFLIGNAAYVFTTREVNDDYEREVSQQMLFP